MRHYVVGPISTVFSDRFSMLNVLCKSENSSVVHATVAGIQRKIVSPVDLCWQLTVSNVSYTFAVLEFKRPGSINGDHWNSALNDEFVTETARPMSATRTHVTSAKLACAT